MKTTGKLLTLLAAVFLSAAALAAQDQPPPLPSSGQITAQEGPGPIPFGDRIEILGFGGWHGGKVVTDAPFSAVATTQTVQTLADGTTITHKTQVNLYRDSQGRFRKEVKLLSIGPLATSERDRTFIIIQDPVAAATYVLNPNRKIARQLPQFAENGPRMKGRFIFNEQNANAKSDMQTESLGTQVFSGVTAQGTRYTRVIPAGQIGNDKPITISSEIWYSPNLQMVVMSKRSDPRFGVTTYTLSNIQRTEPPESLFTVPSDFTLKQGPPRGAMRFMRRGQAPPPPDPAGPDL
jgi:hypothetical protein